MSRPGMSITRDHRGISQGVGILVVLAVALGALSVVYMVTRQQVYADSGSIDFSKLPKTKLNSNVNAT